MSRFPIFTKNFLYILLIAAEIAAIIFLCLSIPALLPAAAAFAGVWLFTAVTVTVIISRGPSPEINCALALLAIVLPVAGGVIYFIVTAKRYSYGALRVESDDKRGGIFAAARTLCGTCAADYDRAVYLKSGEEYFDLLFREIAGAKKSVYLEYFILGRGEIFSRLLSALAAAHKRGAEIKIIADGVGSAFRIGRKELKLLKAAGAEVKIFHRITPFPRAKLNFRDHRKIAAIDGKTAFTGGINLADEYANLKSPYGYWKDTGVAVYGGAAAQFEAMFLSVWRGEYSARAPAGGARVCLPFCDSPPMHNGFCENAYINAISNAKRRVHVFTPYFCVSEKTASALSFAAMRGVDVKIIIPHVPDKKYAFELTKACALPLLKRGVKFYEYVPGFMHAKSMICDDELFIGSYNFDYRSMRLNYECGVMLCGEETADAERDFNECLSLSAPLSDEKPPFPRRALRFFIRLLSPIM